jgi:UDP-galactopyranose mutase
VADENGVEKLVPIPPTQETVNTLFPSNTNVRDEKDMEAWYDARRVVPRDAATNEPRPPENGEEAALSRVGHELYEKIFKHYTKKQWDKYPNELDASVLMRLPCRTTTDDRYFGDAYQALPLRGYTRLFENMLLRDPGNNIAVRLNCDFFEHKRNGTLPKHKLLVYTGQIDTYYAALGMPKLEYRSLRFEEEFVENCDGGFFQSAMVVNHPGPDKPFTRVVEYKHTPNQPQSQSEKRKSGTLIAREYSTDTGEPYYPVPNPENRALYDKYAALAAKEEGVAFVGRLASYKYFNMDQGYFKRAGDVRQPEGKRGAAAQARAGDVPGGGRHEVTRGDVCETPDAPRNGSGTRRNKRGLERSLTRGYLSVVRRTRVCE